ncbi:MAG: hypothetical protein II715_02250 [Clostridia bacterium]|nr:hypothetical protein [Clostridia bacterium]
MEQLHHIPSKTRFASAFSRLLCALLCVLLAACVSTACGAGTPGESAPVPADSSAQDLSLPASEAEKPESSIPEEVSEMESKADPNMVPLPDDAQIFTNLDYKNTGKMGDNDGPAVCYYTRQGYKKASMDVLFSQLKINTVRKDRKFVNAYIFLGCDIYMGGWVNCFDTGFCWSGANPAWHLFYNIYDTGDTKQKKWFESSVRLSPDHDYRLTLDTSEEDGKATIVIYDITDEKEADRKTFSVNHLKADGSNTAYLMDFALDYPDNVRMDPDGKPTDDWEKITLYNSDRNLYMRNLLVRNTAVLPSGAEEMIPWTSDLNSARSLWPDKSLKQVDYKCTWLMELPSENGLSFRVDLDMNRHEEQ